MSDAVYNKEQIMEIIPHRDPFLLIDEINEIEPGKRVVATKHINEDDFWFKGHFPEYPGSSHDRNACAGRSRGNAGSS